MRHKPINILMILLLILGLVLIGINLDINLKIINIALSKRAGYYSNLIGILVLVIDFSIFYETYIKIKVYRSLRRASKDIKKVLDENSRIFHSYGPNSCSNNISKLRMANELNLWEEKKRYILSEVRMS